MLQYQTANTHTTPVLQAQPRRVVTATTLFDGHDVSVNLIRRLLQSAGAEVIHLGHSRSAEEIVRCAIQEDAHAIAVTSYQGGHMEFFRYMHDLLKMHNATHIRIFGGGGGTILPAEQEALHNYGITRIYSPQDGREMGLQGMIADLLERCDIPVLALVPTFTSLGTQNDRLLATLITLAENCPELHTELRARMAAGANGKKVPVVGITGTGGAGKSTLIDELLRRFLLQYAHKRVAVLCVDPSRRKTGGALLGDRIRMNTGAREQVFIRSLATRSSFHAPGETLGLAIEVCKAAGFDLVLVETPGIGQSDTAIADLTDISMYVMTGEFGAPSQLEKINMLDYADLIAINKYDKGNTQDVLRQVRRQYRQNHGLWDLQDEAMPVVTTNAVVFNDAGVTGLYRLLLEKIRSKTGCLDEEGIALSHPAGVAQQIIPLHRAAYLDEIINSLHSYNRTVDIQANVAQQLFQLQGAREVLQQYATGSAQDTALQQIALAEKELEQKLHTDTRQMLDNWEANQELYRQEEAVFNINGKQVAYQMQVTTLSHLKIPKVAMPAFESWGERVRWGMQENRPGYFPFTAGVFPMKREGEEPARLTAGEGGAERSNKRFHYLTRGMEQKRLSTAHDAVTLYGFDPDHRPDIFGKIGSTGVSISTVDDAKILYSGFNLADSRTTSVNLTINGPSPMILAFFMNAAIDQQCELYIRRQGLTESASERIAEMYRERGLPRPAYKGALPAGNDGLGLLLLGVSGSDVLPAEIYEQIRTDTLRQVRGTVQCDILKEEQAQNTCIFSLPFSLKSMADIQEYFVKKQIRNFYTVSVSGYHMAEAGANPVTQIAFTLANAFTYIEYYLSRGLKVDDFAPHFSFFFSNGTDPEYAVLGRVARRIWAKVLKYRYEAGERAQKLKYHIQTSGRSLQAQEIDFNDIRTTLQALYAVYDNCNSLHTNAHDEAISLPTETTVRKAQAIQKIIDKELGLARNTNPLQGAFIIEELTNLVEEAVITELNNIARRGGVLTAMESMYQRTRIQEESMYYETLKHNGSLPIVGVNTFVSELPLPAVAVPEEVVRITDQERNNVIATNQAFIERNRPRAAVALNRLAAAVTYNHNIFDCLMEISKVCTLGQMSATLFEAGGEYRRNM